MGRLLTSSAIVLAVLALSTLAHGQTVFTEDFEDPPYTVGNDVAGTNGWFVNFAEGSPTPFKVAAGATGLTGQVGDSNFATGGFYRIANPAGIPAGGPDPLLEYALSWKWLVNADGKLASPTGAVGLVGTRSGIAIVRDDSNSFEGWQLNVFDVDDTDRKYPLPDGPQVEQLLDLAIVFNSTNTRYYVNGDLLQTSPSTGVSGSFANITGIQWQCGAEGNTGCGFIDDIRVVPEPASLGLLALGGIALLPRRRRA